jgi:hypothetical protein
VQIVEIAEALFELIKLMISYRIHFYKTNSAAEGESNDVILDSFLHGLFQG